MSTEPETDQTANPDNPEGDDPQQPDPAALDDPHSVLTASIADADELRLALRLGPGTALDPATVVMLAILRTLRLGQRETTEALSELCARVTMRQQSDLAETHLAIATGPSAELLGEHLRATEHALTLEAQRRRELVHLVVALADGIRRGSPLEALAPLLEQADTWRATLPPDTPG